MKSPFARVALLGFLALSGLLAGCGNGSFGGHVEIAKPANTVFDWITQSDKRKQWDTGVVKEIPLNNLPPGVGARNREVISMNGHEMTLDAEVTEFVPGKHLAVHLVGSGMDLHATYDLVEAAGVTNVDYHGNFEITNFFMKPMAGMVQAGSVDKMNGDLARLKAIVEKQP